MKKFFKKYYKETILLYIILVFSLLNMKKAYLIDNMYINHFYKQFIWIIIGITFYVLIYRIKFKIIFKLRYLLYFINIFLLIYVLLFSKSINGIKAWISISSFKLQPSELIKITYPIISIYLIRNKKYILNFLFFLFPFILILLEPDTGNAALLLLLFIYLILNKKNKKIIYIISGLITVSLLGSILLFYKYPNIFIKAFNGSLYYRFKRLYDFKNNYQINSALIGIGSAKLYPLPLNKILIYIPEGITDFVFSFSLCNFGIILAIMLVTCYFLFSYLLLKKYKKRKYYYSKKLLGSFLVIFIFQEIYNILMNLGLVPIMGIPLPFLSYGGSNIITYFIFLSIATKKISSIEDKDNNSYKNNYHKVH